MLRLFTTFYGETRAERAAEYLSCLELNMSCSAIDSIHVLVEGDMESSLPATVRIRQIDRRPTYDDFFAWINEIASDTDVSVIANTDIWFDASIAVLKGHLAREQCLALSRWEGDRLFDRNDSQDCWVFRGHILRVRGDFPLGVPRCDNRLLYELRAAGYSVLNPAFSIRAHHVHAGGQRDYAHDNPGYFVDPPYAYLWPHNIWPLPRTLAYNVLHPDAKIGWRFDRRKAAATLPVRAARRIARMMAAPRGKA